MCSEGGKYESYLRSEGRTVKNGKMRNEDVTLAHALWSLLSQCARNHGKTTRHAAPVTLKYMKAWHVNPPQGQSPLLSPPYTTCHSPSSQISHITSLLS